MAYKSSVRLPQPGGSNRGRRAIEGLCTRRAKLLRCKKVPKREGKYHCLCTANSLAQSWHDSQRQPQHWMHKNLDA